MTSEDAAILDDIQVKLNLNCMSDAVQLPEARRNVLDAFISELPVEHPEETLLYCQEVLELFENEADPKTPYVGILLWWLRDYIGSFPQIEQ